MGMGSHIVPKDSERERELTEGRAKGESADRDMCRLTKVKGDQGEAWRESSREGWCWAWFAGE